MVKPREIRKKILDRKISAQDRDMNVISVKDIVRVLDGHYKVTQKLVE
jgi:transcription elongation factor SPT5